MYSNAAGTAQLGNGTTATVNSGHFQIWVRSSGEKLNTESSGWNGLRVQLGCRRWSARIAA